MARLIDADALLEQYNLKDATKYGNKDSKQQAHSYSTMMLYEIADMIDGAPTAYDTDKVVEELEENASRYTKKYATPYGNNGYRDTKAISIHKAIEIVKQGGTSVNYSIQDIDNAIKNRGLLQSE